MKRYKLKKDTPAFKAGTECYIEEAGNMVPCRGISYTIVHKDQLEKNPNILTDWFEEIKPAEPLIKDEKIRSVIRTWAEINNIKMVFICALPGGWGVQYNLAEDGYYFIDLLFKGYAPLEVGNQYNIAELCGEEEE